MSQLVTVYIPTYNRLHLLQRAVDSVLNQTYKNIELIVVDDNSNDGTKDYLTELAKKDHRVNYKINTSNLGASASRNKAIQAASGEFITGLDDDDYFLRRRIEDFLDVWRIKKPKTIALFTSVTKKVGEKDFFLDKKISIVSQRDLLYSNYLGNQVFVPIQALREIHGFDAVLLAWQDLDCWYRLLAEGLAERVDNQSYVMDISHAHERISKDALQKVDESFEVFCKKYQLGYRDSIRLVCQKTGYSPALKKYIKNCFFALLILDMRLLRISLARLKKYFLGRIYM
jgi:glycosyltransferase involved in cell wall biosynthesis